VSKTGESLRAPPSTHYAGKGEAVSALTERSSAVIRRVQEKNKRHGIHPVNDILTERFNRLKIQGLKKPVNGYRPQRGETGASIEEGTRERKRYKY